MNWLKDLSHLLGAVAFLATLATFGLSALRLHTCMEQATAPEAKMPNRTLNFSEYAKGSARTAKPTKAPHEGRELQGLFDQGALWTDNIGGSYELSGQ
jgi:hypothetical protein